MPIRRELGGLLIPAFINNLRTPVVGYRRWKQDALEFQKDRNLQDGDVGYLLFMQLAGSAKQLAEELSAANAAASDGLSRIWMRLDRVFHYSSRDRWDVVLGQWERA